MTEISAIVFLVCAGAMLYILAGYPLLLALIARRKWQPVRKDNALRSVSFNHPPPATVKDSSRPKLRSILELSYPRS